MPSLYVTKKLLLKPFLPLDFVVSTLQKRTLTSGYWWKSEVTASQAKDKSNSEGRKLNSALSFVASDHDKDAFKIIFDYFVPRLKGFLMRQGTDLQLTEEIVQEVLLTVWKKASQFDPQKASASTWIFTIARNKRIDILRKIHRPEPDFNDPTFTQGSETDSQEIISKEQEAKYIREAIVKLPKEQQTVLDLAFFHEKSHGEIANELKIPLGTVKSRIRLALKHIKTNIGRTYENQPSPKR